MQEQEQEPLVFRRPVTLVGGGALTRAMLDEALALAPELVAADGAADRLAGWGVPPAAVIGDMDSIADPGRWHGTARVVRLSEQESTDFEKCLYATEAPFYLGTGFTGGRVDHLLAVFSAMLARPEKRVLLLGEADAIALAPARRVLGIDLAIGARVSVLPLAPVTGTHSRGLAWSVENLAMAPGVRTASSNIATENRVEFGFDAPGALVIVGRRHLAALVRAFCEP